MVSLNVTMNGIAIGLLRKTKDGGLLFNYTQEWLGDMKRHRPLSLSMPLSRETYKGDVVYNFFDNLLPDLEAW